MALKIGIQEGRTLAAALAWLIGLPPTTPARLIYARARTMRLLASRERDGWRADGRLGREPIKVIPESLRD